MVNRRFPELDCGHTSARLLTLRGATLLHVAGEYGNLEAARFLLDRGAQVDARATVDENGVGGQTPIFHAVTQFDDWGFPAAQLLVERGSGVLSYPPFFICKPPPNGSVYCLFTPTLAHQRGCATCLY